MAEIYGEANFKQCLQAIINSVSDTITNLNGKANEQQLLNDLKKQLKTILEKYLSSLSSPARAYLLDVLYQYHYDDKDKTLSNSFTKDLLNPFLHDIQGRLQSVDAFQGAWNGERPIVENFLKNYPNLKDKSGLFHTTLLYCAARNNHLNLVQYLIETAKCYVNAQNEEYVEKGQQPTDKATIGSTALHTACYNGHLQTVEYLIKHGGDYFISNKAYETPIENGTLRSAIRQFFRGFLLFSYSANEKSLPQRTILQEIEDDNKTIIDCFWEYKPIGMNQWFPFPNESCSELQQKLMNQDFKEDLQLSTGRHPVNVSLIQFLRYIKHDDEYENPAWVRCRGSSLRNFHAYSQWQIMFIKHPRGTKNATTSTEILNMTSNKIQLNSWYNVDMKMNNIFETAMNYHRRYVIVSLDLIDNEKLTFDLENFSFMNKKTTIEGFLRWIPKFITDKKDLTPIDNSQLSKTTNLKLLTRSCVKQAQTNGHISTDQFTQYQLKYENAFQNDDFSFVMKESAEGTPMKRPIKVVRQDLLTIQTDVIIVSALSQYLVQSVVKAAGSAFKKTFETKITGTETSLIVPISASGQLACKAVYFVMWVPNSNPNKLRQSIEELVTQVIQQAAHDNYKTIGFPAIGCGEYGYPIDLIAQTLIKQTRSELSKYSSITVSFVIQPTREDIYQEFRKQAGLTDEEEDDNNDESTITTAPIINIGKGTMEVEKGDITKQNVDVIVGSSSSENLRRVLLKAAGNEVETAYKKEYENNPNALIITTPPGLLKCKRIFFLKWEPDQDQDILQQSLIDLIGNVIQNAQAHKFTSIAFPAIGCGEFNFSVDLVVKTMVKEMKRQMEKRKLAWTIKFIIYPTQQNVYDEFCKQLLSSDHVSNDYQLPPTWTKTNNDQLLVTVPKTSEEYKSIIGKFDEVMNGYYVDIVKLERIQNERWYMQYMAHVKDFQKRLNQDTEKRLYHGCPEDAAQLIAQDCFNRSFAGKNGVKWGYGVYFSSNAPYSTQFAKPNAKGERCMFLSRVLVGKTTVGNDTMKVRPLGFDSTTDGKHIFVTYHDAQAYAEYLITFK